MNNWFQSDKARELFVRYLYAQSPSCACVAHVQGHGWTKRAIVQAGPRIEPNAAQADVHAMLADMAQQAQAQRCVYAEIRCMADYSPYHDLFEAAGWMYEPHYDIVIATNNPIPETKMRQVRAAQRDGLSWRLAQTEEDVIAWSTCLMHLYRTKVHRPLPDDDFFLRAWHLGLPLIVVENSQTRRIVGGVLLAVDETTAYEWYICGQVMSTYAAIEWCREHGIAHFDTMGAGRPGVQYGVRDFKLQMGGELHEWGRYRYVCRPLLYRLGAMAIEFRS